MQSNHKHSIQNQIKLTEEEKQKRIAIKYPEEKKKHKIVILCLQVPNSIKMQFQT